MKIVKSIGILSLAAILVFGLSLLTGCQKASEKNAEKMMENILSKATGGKADVKIKDGKVAVATKDGTTEWSAGGTTEWPADLTLDIPKIEGKVKAVIRTSSPQGKHWTISLDGVAADAPAQYVKALEAKGWTIGLNMTTEQGGSAQATKDKDSIVLTYGGSDKNLVLSVTVGLTN
jgi:hypothetical protein